MDAMVEKAKKAGLSMTGQVEAVATSKKRKQHVVSRDPSEAQVPEVVPVPPPAPTTVVQVVNLEEDVAGSSLVPASGVRTMAFQTATLVTIIEAPATNSEVPACAIVTTIGSTQVAPATSPPMPSSTVFERGESSARLAS